MRGSYTIAPNIDAFLAQVVRLAGNGYYFYFRGELKPSKDPLKLDAKLIQEWQLDQPYWKREKRRRGEAPSIWYLRFERQFLLPATHGRTEEGQAHRFFTEYGSTLKDIRSAASIMRASSAAWSARSWCFSTVRPTAGPSSNSTSSRRTGRSKSVSAPAMPSAKWRNGRFAARPSASTTRSSWSTPRAVATPPRSVTAGLT